MGAWLSPYLSVVSNAWLWVHTVPSCRSLGHTEKGPTPLSVPALGQGPKRTRPLGPLPAPPVEPRLGPTVWKRQSAAGCRATAPPYRRDHRNTLSAYYDPRTVVVLSHAQEPAPRIATVPHAYTASPAVGQRTRVRAPCPCRRLSTAGKASPNGSNPRHLSRLVTSADLAQARAWFPTARGAPLLTWPGSTSVGNAGAESMAPLLRAESPRAAAVGITSRDHRTRPVDSQNVRYITSALYDGSPAYAIGW